MVKHVQGDAAEGFPVDHRTTEWNCWPVIEGLERLTRKGWKSRCTPIPSTSWMPVEKRWVMGWEKKDTKAKEPGLVAAFLGGVPKHAVKFHGSRATQANPLNERVDAMAVAAYQTGTC
jgi:ribonuclease HI